MVTAEKRRRDNRIGLAILLAAVVFLALVSLVHTPKSSDQCEQLWQENQTTASVPQLADNGHQRYLDACHQGNKLVRELHDSGAVR